MKVMTVVQDDGTKWAVPVEMIARHRAEHYAHEFDNDIERSLVEDTGPLFEEDEYEIQDWAVNNMDWSNFDGHQFKVEDAPPPNFEHAWMDGAKEFVDITP